MVLVVLGVILSEPFMNQGLKIKIKIVAINELADPKGIAHLLKYDTSHGRFSFPVNLGEDTLTVAGDSIALFAEEPPGRIALANP